MIYVVMALLCLVSFYVGVFVGIKDCKKHYGIGKGDAHGCINNSNLDSAEQ